MTDTNIGGHDRASSACISHTLDGTYERSCCGSGDPLLSNRRSEVRPQLLLTDGQYAYRTIRMDLRLHQVADKPAGRKSGIALVRDGIRKVASVRDADYTDKWNIDLCRDRHRKVVTYRNEAQWMAPFGALRHQR